MKKHLFIFLLLLPILASSQSLNYISLDKADSLIYIGYQDQNKKDTVVNINKNQSQAYNYAVQLFQADTIINIFFQISKAFTLGEPPRIIAKGPNSWVIVNYSNLPYQAQQIFDAFKQEVLTLITH